MQNSVVVINRGTAFMSVKQLAEELGLSQKTIRILIKGIQEEIMTGRYSRYAIAGNRYSFYVVVDYLKYHKLLEDRNLRKTVPDFDPAEVAELCGYNQKIVNM